MSVGILSSDLRRAFLDHFASADHTVVPSASLVPHHDPSLLFVNAGMVPFKEAFLGRETPDHVRLASSQICMRAGGKHNDLDAVGRTDRHLTLFEMLGNFSFGDYFKEQAIELAWACLTHTLGMNPERLWITVFFEDDEAYRLWQRHVPEKRIIRCGADDNFWAMGDTGPCGPCSEIHYDLGPEHPGGLPGSDQAHLGRYLEIWNLVFMQYNRTDDGVMEPLPNPCVDTGMGLERLCSVMQGCTNNFDTDLLSPMVHSARALCERPPHDDVSLRVLADHARAVTFLMADGVRPHREGRGYVLRRIVRRALRHAHRIALPPMAFLELTTCVSETMGEVYPHITEAMPRVHALLTDEITAFWHTLSQGMQRVDKILPTLTGRTFPGDEAFLLYDTYGFPLDMLKDMLYEHKLDVDRTAFETAMASQKARSRKKQAFKDMTSSPMLVDKPATERIEGAWQASACVLELITPDLSSSLSQVTEGQKAVVVVDKTPCYPESGGQVGDVGTLTDASGRKLMLHDTTGTPQGVIYHHVSMAQGQPLRVGDTITLHVDRPTREATARNHSATHLLHAALRHVLGPTVEQRGSRVHANGLRFDFAWSKPITRDQKHAILAWIQHEIMQNTPVQVCMMSRAQAQAQGAIALFDEKYGEMVRVLDIGASRELCGGTHVSRTGDIGPFFWSSESSVGSGIRRIEALTGHKAFEAWWSFDHEMHTLSEMCKTPQDGLLAFMHQCLEERQTLKKASQKRQQSVLQDMARSCVQKAQACGPVQLVVSEIQELSDADARSLIDTIKRDIPYVVVLLVQVKHDKVSMWSGIHAPSGVALHAGHLVQALAPLLNGRGGGRADFAQGGGTNVQAVPQVLAAVRPWVQEASGATL